MWTKHGAMARNPAALPSGDYVPPNTPFIIQELLAADQGDGHYVFHVESVRASNETADQTIQVEIDFGNGWVALDKVSFTSLPLDLAVDANRD